MLTDIVNNCLEEYVEGECFFDAIDSYIRNNDFLIATMIDKILTYEKFDYLIVSGRFGKNFKDYILKYRFDDLKDKIIVVNGNLRHDDEVIDFYNTYDILNKEFIFVDDSYYLGRTRDKIKEAILNHGGRLITTYVFYDGSKIKDENVHSFYRYYDNF